MPTQILGNIGIQVDLHEQAESFIVDSLREVVNQSGVETIKTSYVFYRIYIEGVFDIIYINNWSYFKN